MSEVVDVSKILHFSNLFGHWVFFFSSVFQLRFFFFLVFCTVIVMIHRGSVALSSHTNYDLVDLPDIAKTSLFPYYYLLKVRHWKWQWVHFQTFWQTVLERYRTRTIYGAFTQFLTIYQMHFQVFRNTTGRSLGLGRVIWKYSFNNIACNCCNSCWLSGNCALRWSNWTWCMKRPVLRCLDNAVPDFFLQDFVS